MYEDGAVQEVIPTGLLLLDCDRLPSDPLVGTFSQSVLRRLINPKGDPYPAQTLVAVVSEFSQLASNESLESHAVLAPVFEELAYLPWLELWQKIRWDKQRYMTQFRDQSIRGFVFARTMDPSSFVCLVSFDIATEAAPLAHRGRVT